MKSIVLGLAPRGRASPQCRALADRVTTDQSVRPDLQGGLWVSWTTSEGLRPTLGATLGAVAATFVNFERISMISEPIRIDSGALVALLARTAKAEKLTATA